MKLLLIHDDSDFAEPMIRCAPQLAECGIEMEAVATNSEESVERLVHQSHNVLLVFQTRMSDVVADCGKPVIIMERLDGAQLFGARRWISRTKGVIKSYALRPPELHNKYSGRIHAHLMSDAGYRAPEQFTRAPRGQPLPQLSTSELRLIRLGYGFGAHNKLNTLFRQYIDWSSKRDYAVHFAGHISYDHSEVETHRKMAYEATYAWCKKHPNQGIAVAGRKLAVPEYYRTMFLSRAVVSPWGWGESAHRDYEAMTLGAVVIKPPMGHVDCWPQIYIPGETYVECRLDFADVPEIVDRITMDWKLWTAKRQRARELVENAAHPARIARAMAASVRSLL